MAIELVTAYKGKDHVTAEQWADFNRGIYGDAAILPVGNKMETAIQTANQITVKDGVAVIDGRQVYIGYGESENIAIQSGTQGKLRRDIVVLEYKKEETSGVETVQFKVITGTPADSDAKDPSVQDMDIRTGVFTSQKPFCRVRLNGTAIEGVDTLIPVKEFKSHAFAAPVNNLTGTNPDLALAATQGREIKKQIDALNSSLEFEPFNGSESVIKYAETMMSDSSKIRIRWISIGDSTSSDNPTSHSTGFISQRYASAYICLFDIFSTNIIVNSYKNAGWSGWHTINANR